MGDEVETPRPDWRPRIMEPDCDPELRPEDEALKASLCRALQAPPEVRDRLYRFVAKTLQEQGIDPLAPGRVAHGKASDEGVPTRKAWWLFAAAACLLICAGLFFLPGDGKDPFMLEVVQAATVMDPATPEIPIAPERTEHCYCAVLENVRSAVQHECHIPELENAGYVFEGASASARLGGERAVTLLYRQRETGQPLYLHVVWDLSVSFRRAEMVAQKSPAGDDRNYWVEREDDHAVVCWEENDAVYALVLPAPGEDTDDSREQSLHLAREIRHPRVVHSLPS